MGIVRHAKLQHETRLREEKTADETSDGPADQEVASASPAGSGSAGLPAPPAPPRPSNVPDVRFGDDATESPNSAGGQAVSAGGGASRRSPDGNARDQPMTERARRSHGCAPRRG
eukprot:1005938-Pyramimonas_sp.AAC.1